ncbi:MAG: biotin/lipoyl-binding protein, partial [Actinomycetia bacterium]|nr:biotin/lipoyl-binding protein [Actinomycetes bacterium]
SVVPGDTLVVLESMKMEIPVLAEASGIVAEIVVSVGDVVNEGDILVILQ